MPFISTYYEDLEMDTFIKDTVDEYSNFFGKEFNYKRFSIHVIKDRNTMNALRGGKSDDYARATCINDTIYFYHKDSLEKETNGYHVYNAIDEKLMIRHEICHNCFRLFRFGNIKPKRLNEGTAIYLSGQIKRRIKPSTFSSFLSFYITSGEDIYKESGFVIDLLIREFGKDMFLKLLVETKDIYEDLENKFNVLFKNIYGNDLTYDFMNILLEKYYTTGNS